MAPSQEFLGVCENQVFLGVCENQVISRALSVCGAFETVLYRELRKTYRHQWMKGMDGEKLQAEERVLFP